VESCMVKFILMLMLAPLLCFANPAPFGLEIGKMTVQEFKAKYDYKHEGDSKSSKGSSYSISVKNFNFDGLEHIRTEFDQNQVLVAVTGYFNADKFDYLLEILEDKYKIIGKKLPPDGEKFACFDTDELYIDLRMYNLDQCLIINYYSKNFWKDIMNICNQEREKDFSNL
jgi:hypothetical protein